MLERIAQYLMKHEKIDGPSFYKLMNGEISVDGDEVTLKTEKTEELAEEKVDIDKKAEETETTQINDTTETKSDDNNE